MCDIGRPKIVIVGATGVGKTSIVNRHTGRHFNPHEAQTIGAGYSLCNVPLIDEEDGEERVVSLQVWDTAGQERFRAMTPMYYRNASGAIVVFSVTERETLRAADKWITELTKFVGGRLSLLLLGNKTDLPKDSWEVSDEQAQVFAHAHDAHFMSASAKEGTNIVEAFEWMARDIVERHTQHIVPTIEQSFQLEEKGRRRKCC